MNNSYLSKLEAQVIDNLMPGNQNSGIGMKLRSALSNGISWKEKQKYYVDGISGDNGNDGLSWDTAFKTIQYACNIARRLDGTTTIDDAKNHDKWIFIAPGHYNEQVLFSGYGIHLIGLGSPALAGKDYGVSINYDNATLSTAVLGFTGVNLELYNICFNTDRAIPAVYIPSTSDGIKIHHCYFISNGTGTNAIDIPSIKASVIEDNYITGYVTGIKAGYSAGQWFFATIIQDNIITSCTNGITIAAGAVCGTSVIQRNKVLCSSVSIANAQATDMIIVENRTKPALTDAGAAAGDNTTLS